jgi:uncharacterized membrane protein
MGSLTSTQTVGTQTVQVGTTTGTETITVSVTRTIGGVQVYTSTLTARSIDVPVVEIEDIVGEIDNVIENTEGLQVIGTKTNTTSATATRLK